jgi:hypothetical protein
MSLLDQLGQHAWIGAHDSDEDAVAYLRENELDSNGDGTGGALPGMMYFRNDERALRQFDGYSWEDVQSAISPRYSWRDDFFGVDLSPAWNTKRKGGDSGSEIPPGISMPGGWLRITAGRRRGRYAEINFDGRMVTSAQKKQVIDSIVFFPSGTNFVAEWGVRDAIEGFSIGWRYDSSESPFVRACVVRDGSSEEASAIVFDTLVHHYRIDCRQQTTASFFVDDVLRAEIANVSQKEMEPWLRIETTSNSVAHDLWLDLWQMSGDRGTGAKLVV